MNEPLISVIVPAHNNEKSIGTALKSICDQTYQNLEIIVVDDHSTDNTREEVLKIQAIDSRVTYLCLTEEDSYRIDPVLKRNVNAGYMSRNLGFEHAKGEYITFQDADDASLLNRIEIQFELLRKYKATHLTLTWLPLNPELLSSRIDADKYLHDHPDSVIGPQELYALSQKTKGRIAKLSTRLNQSIPFHRKRMRALNRLFFGALDPYPGSGNSPLFHRDVISKVQFRPLRTRIWPSFMGRGADRDFNFQVAETFKNSYVVLIPAYLWDTHMNTAETNIRSYLI